MNGKQILLFARQKNLSKIKREFYSKIFTVMTLGELDEHLPKKIVFLILKFSSVDAFTEYGSTWYMMNQAYTQ